MTKDQEKIKRVLIVEDSPLVSKVLAEMLNVDPEIEVVDIVHNGEAAIEAVARLRPDLVTMDLHMPVMDGLEAVKQIMAYHPTPILIVSSSGPRGEMNNIFKAIDYGALDFISKTALGFDEGDRRVRERDGEAAKEDLVEKVKFLSRIKVIRHPLARLEAAGTSSVIQMEQREEALGRIVAIIASTGGPQALGKILKSLPADFPCGIVIVQHIVSGFEEGLAAWLSQEAQIKVKVAEDTEKIRAGVAYLAPCDCHMKINSSKRIVLADGPPYHNHKPSGDLLLESVAEAYGRGVLGVILTGMGRDGADGLKTVKERCGRSIAQDEKSCIVFGMPKSAIEAGVVDQVVPLAEIAKAIAQALKP